ncbi:hypothetical protein [Breznakia pachnodae]|uniref:Uncharacterized protein n=1 Tax=Breznakia pachnodae TaxID=265178 RepID=A0ABU0E155_9FIRM|nr:hypothetical protein [Breznakia pachnodae]MDQ0360616.1 hypothetical protein [Breznakia pachnodae]
MRYRITKYNPEYRAKNGAYTVDDWTAVSDIGMTFDGTILEKSTYLNVENAYINAVLIIMRDFKSSSTVIERIEKWSSHYEIQDRVFALPNQRVKSLLELSKNGMILNEEDIKLIIAMILREQLWCELNDVNQAFKITFGYDYYMYCVCDNLSETIIDEIEKLGLFVDTVNWE